jgi:hypothetical protein
MSFGGRSAKSISTIGNGFVDWLGKMGRRVE